jgi:hypothetical protein
MVGGWRGDGLMDGCEFGESGAAGHDATRRRPGYRDGRTRRDATPAGVSSAPRGGHGCDRIVIGILYYSFGGQEGHGSSPARWKRPRTVAASLDSDGLTAYFPLVVRSVFLGSAALV